MRKIASISPFDTSASILMLLETRLPIGSLRVRTISAPILLWAISNMAPTDRIVCADGGGRRVKPEVGDTVKPEQRMLQLSLEQEYEQADYRETSSFEHPTRDGQIEVSGP